MKLFILTLLMIIFVLLNVGCNENSASSSGFVSIPSTPAPIPAPINVTVKSGRNFDCFQNSKQIYCIGVIDGVTYSTWTLFAESDDVFTAFEVWDDTVCYSANVLDRPWDNAAGVATYCVGEASLGANAGTYPLIYSGPPFGVSHLSPDLDVGVMPFVGYNGPMDLFTDTGGTWLVMTDGSSLVSETTEACTLLGDDLDCPSFDLTLE